jgi:hypothetical protein
MWNVGGRDSNDLKGSGCLGSGSEVWDIYEFVNGRLYLSCRWLRLLREQETAPQIRASRCLNKIHGVHLA